MAVSTVGASVHKCYEIQFPLTVNPYSSIPKNGKILRVSKDNHLVLHKTISQIQHLNIPRCKILNGQILEY